MNEATLIKTLSDTHVLPIIASAIYDFVKQTHYQPELVRVNASLRMAVIKELINGPLDFLPADAVAEPIWIDNIPMIFAKDLGESYVVITNKRIRKELRL